MVPEIAQEEKLPISTNTISSVIVDNMAAKELPTKQRRHRRIYTFEGAGRTTRTRARSFGVLGADAETCVPKELREAQAQLPETEQSQQQEPAQCPAEPSMLEVVSVPDFRHVAFSQGETKQENSVSENENSVKLIPEICRHKSEDDCENNGGHSKASAASLEFSNPVSYHIGSGVQCSTDRSHSSSSVEQLRNSESDQLNIGSPDCAQADAVCLVEFPSLKAEASVFNAFGDQVAIETELRESQEMSEERSKISVLPSNDILPPAVVSSDCRAVSPEKEIVGRESDCKLDEGLLGGEENISGNETQAQSCISTAESSLGEKKLHDLDEIGLVVDLCPKASNLQTLVVSPVHAAGFVASGNDDSTEATILESQQSQPVVSEVMAEIHVSESAPETINVVETDVAGSGVVSDELSEQHPKEDRLEGNAEMSGAVSSDHSDTPPSADLQNCKAGRAEDSEPGAPAACPQPSLEVDSAALHGGSNAVPDGPPVQAVVPPQVAA